MLFKILQSGLNKVSLCVVSPRAIVLTGKVLFYLTGRNKRRKLNCFADAEKVLVVRLDEIGDVVMTSPFLRELRRNLPGAWITLVVKPSLVNLVELCPYVNEVLAYESIRKVYAFGLLRQHWRDIKSAIAFTFSRRQVYDLAIVPRWDADYYNATYLAYFSGAPWRIGYSESVTEHKRMNNKGYDLFYTHLVDQSTNEDVKHEVERNLGLIKYMGGTVQDSSEELWLSNEDEAYARSVLGAEERIEGNLMYAFGIGAGAEKRKWDISNYISLGRWLIDEYKIRLLVLGGKGEVHLGEMIKKELGDDVIEMVGRTTIRQAGALLKKCKMYVGNDSGLMHIAAAARIPVIEISCHTSDGKISHYNSPARFGPWGVPNIVIQPEKAIHPCIDSCEEFKPHCISSITIESVKQSIVDLINDSDGHQ